MLADNLLGVVVFEKFLVFTLRGTLLEEHYEACEVFRQPSPYEVACRLLGGNSLVRYLPSKDRRQCLYCLV